MRTSRIAQKIISVERDRTFLDRLGKNLGFRKEDDWYKIQMKDISTTDRGIWRSLLSNFGNSPSKLLESVYPHHRWLAWHFDSVFRGWWDIKENQKEYMEWLGRYLRYRKMEDWYKITKEDMSTNSGSTLLKRYGTVSNVVTSVFSDHPWQLWKFHGSWKRFWNSKANQLDFMDGLGRQLGFKSMEDWYGSNLTNIAMENGGFALLGKYQGSLSELIKSTYPNHLWTISRFDSAMNQFMSINYNQKKFLDMLGIHLQIKSPEDWYQITSKEILEQGGQILLSKYGNSIPKMVMSIYPEKQWMIWRFRGSSWNLPEMSQRKELMTWLGKELKVDSLEEWYRISWSQIHEKISPELFKRYSLETLLQESYPNHKWNLSKFQFKNLGTMKASQRLLAKTLKEIFPESEVIEDYQHSHLIREHLTKRMQLDIYLPKERLAFEYQGGQHYYEVHALGSLWIQKERDNQKRKECQEQNIQLIEVPYWWDNKKSSLVATIHAHAPHLVPSKGDGKPIPDDPPLGFPKNAILA